MVNDTATTSRTTHTGTGSTDRNGHQPASTTSYLTAIPVSRMFRDDTYQRPLDWRRVHRMAGDWNPRMVGYVDVSDRGEDAGIFRYAVVNGQHRWAAAKHRDDRTVLVANVHSGLAVVDEAALFHAIDRGTKALTTWDKWKARDVAGDALVRAVRTVADTLHLRIDQAPEIGNLRCISTCEKVVRLGGPALLESALRIIVDAWGIELAALERPLVHGVALVLHEHQRDIDHERFTDALAEVAPQQVKARAVVLREAEPGSLGRCVSRVLITVYNGTKGPKLHAHTTAAAGRIRRGRRS